jgi:hypothetical protein
MAVDDLPLPVVNFLNVIGVPWPYVDEDVVSQFAQLTRKFGTAVRTTHDDATQTLGAIASVYQGASTDAMTAGWAKLSARHVDEIVDGCHVLAAALDAAASYIIAQKAEAAAVLVGLAAAFVADQAVAVATAGIAEAAMPVIVATAERLVKSLVMDLQQHIVGEVVEKAAESLFDKIESAMSGLDWSQSGAVAEPVGSVSLDADAVAAHVATLRMHAQTVQLHGAAYQAAVSSLAF